MLPLTCEPETLSQRFRQLTEEDIERLHWRLKRLPTISGAAWTASAIFRNMNTHLWGNLAAYDLDSDALKAALYNNTITPDKDVTAANTAYNVGQWATAQEVFQAGQWAQGGVALSGLVIAEPSSGVTRLLASATSSGAAATLANCYGCEVYDSTLTASGSQVANQGISFNYFGGVQSVTGGTLTLTWDATNGIIKITV